MLIKKIDDVSNNVTRHISIDMFSHISIDCKNEDGDERTFKYLVHELHYGKMSTKSKNRFIVLQTKVLIGPRGTTAAWLSLCQIQRYTGVLVLSMVTSES